MTTQKIDLNDVTREIADIITNLETVQELVLDGNVKSAIEFYKLTMGQARKFCYRFKAHTLT